MTLDDSARHPASLRDPSGYVAIIDGEIRRVVTRAGIEDFEAVEKTGLLDRLMQSGDLWPYGPCEGAADFPSFYGFSPAKVLSHPRLPFVSYPYEWGFRLLKAAAITHLEIQLEALTSAIVLKDASAYNIQFDGTKPVFIDHLSFRPYQSGEYWTGHDQFCRQFLAPLVFEAETRVSPSAWYRGSPAGLDPSEVSALLPLRRKLRPITLLNIVLPAYLARKSRRSGGEVQISKRAAMPREAYERMLRSLLNGIRKLKLDTGETVWSEYSPTTSYNQAAARAKEEFITQVVGASRPRQVLDIGCNDGYYSSVALQAGAASVIGFEGDRGALDRAYVRAVDKGLNFLPLFIDMANPTPAQGWANKERDSLASRAHADFLQALAVIHHLILGLNIPMQEVIDVLVDLAPSGIIEFVPLSDPMAARLAAGREALFANYNTEAFRAAVNQKATIKRELKIPDSDRVLVLYQRHATA